jgi:hypothetical protein
LARHNFIGRLPKTNEPIPPPRQSYPPRLQQTSKTDVGPNQATCVGFNYETYAGPSKLPRMVSSAHVRILQNCRCNREGTDFPTDSPRQLFGFILLQCNGALLICRSRPPHQKEPTPSPTKQPTSTSTCCKPALQPRSNLQRFNLKAYALRRAQLSILRALQPQSLPLTTQDIFSFAATTRPVTDFSDLLKTSPGPNSAT